jgi:hypothetical protein
MLTDTVLYNLETQDHAVLFKTREPDPFVWEQYLEFIKIGAYPYTESVANFIAKQLPELTRTQRRNLSSHVYYSADRHHQIKERERAERMKAEGWAIADSASIKNAFDNGTRKIRMIRTVDGIIGSPERNEVFKLIQNSAGRLFLMAPKARTRGLPVDCIYNGHQHFFRKEG